MPKNSLNVSLKGADDIFSTEESRQEQQREQVQQIPIGELFPFKNHPFKVLDDESMQRTVESVEQYGVLSPLIARPRPEGGYEIISGHRRQHAAQLAGLENLPVICRTVDVFDKCAMIDEIIVVTQQELLEKVSRYLKAYDKMRMVVAGGETRTDSVMAGLAAVSDRTQLVAVHDGARPLVTDAVICRAVSKAKKFGAAAPAVRVKDTIKVSTDGAVEETPDRSKLYAVQTPQVFDRDLLAAALQNAKEQEIAITDDCSAVEALGVPVQLTDGDEENLKITTPLDLELAALILCRRANA